jgi:hypothetical protein
MRKLFILLTIITGMFSSCEKELNQIPLSSASTLTFYASTNDFLQGTIAMYSALKGYPDRQLNLSETRSDNLYAVSDGGVRDWEGINSFHKTISSNIYVTEAWTANFNGIFTANILLDQLKQKGDVIADPALRTRLEAEGRFLRAFYYFDLIRWFGKVPLVDHPLTATEALSLPRSPVADVYNLIIADLKFAADNLPESYAAKDRGKATKFAAKGMLALVYMTRSGPTYSIEGPGLGLNEWALAVPLLNDIIASPLFSFLPSYSNIFSYTNENNAEVIFDVQYSSGSNPVVGATFPWVLVPDRYFESIGKARQGGVTIRPVSNDLMSKYETGDTRKAFTIKNGYVFNGVQEDGSFFQKYVDITKVPANRVDWPINFIVLRFTDILLLKAECVLHGAPGSQAADVDAAVNRVRARGGLTSPKANITLDQLMEERRKEFASEGSRWHDLVRSGLVESAMTSWIAKDDVLKQIQPFQKNYIIYPIPQAELDVKQGLYIQNSGY